MSKLIERLENPILDNWVATMAEAATRIKELEEYVTGAEEDAEDYSKRLVIAERRVAELEADLKGREAVADSYAEENQRFHDRIEKLEAERDYGDMNFAKLQAERDAIKAATIERCAQTAMSIRAPKSIGRDHARHHEAGAQAAAGAIRALAKPLHKSDCAVNNGPALPPGPCNCGAED